MTDIIARLEAATEGSREEWRPAPEYESRYEVSSLGRVKNSETGKMLKGSVPDSRREYPCVNFRFRTDGKAHRIAIHRLVAIAFLGPPPHLQFSRAQVRHLDGNHMNPAATNLRWGTAFDNAQDRARHKRTAMGERHGCAKLSERDIRNIIRDPRSTKYVAADYKVHRTTIQRIRGGQRWAALKARQGDDHG